MVTIEPELRCPAPRPARLRPGARRRFTKALILFLLVGGVPLFDVIRQIWACQVLQRDGHSVSATVLRRTEPRLGGLWLGSLECGYVIPTGQTETARVAVNAGWWRASPPGSEVTITLCDRAPGYAALGEPSTLQFSAELGLIGYGQLILGLIGVIGFGARLRPYFRDLTLVSLGTPVQGRVVGKSWKAVHCLGRQVAVPMIHLYFRDPFGVERVRTQIVDGSTWAQVAEGENMTVLVCAKRRGWLAAYPLLMAEAAPPRKQTAVALGSERV